MNIYTVMILAALISVARANLSCHVAIKVLPDEFTHDDEPVLPFDPLVRPLASPNSAYRQKRLLQPCRNS